MEEILHIDPRVLIIQIGGFILLLLVFKKFLFRPVLAILQARQDEIQASYATAEAEKARMEDLRMDYERRLSDIESEARQRIQATVKEAKELREHILEEARGNAEQILSRAHQEVAREHEKVLVELRREVVDLTIGAASNLIERTLDDSAHKKLVDDFIDSVEVKQ